MTFAERLTQLAKGTSGVWLGPAEKGKPGPIMCTAGFGNGPEGFGATAEEAFEAYRAKGREQLLAAAAREEQEGVKRIQRGRELREMAALGDEPASGGTL